MTAPMSPLQLAATAVCVVTLRAVERAKTFGRDVSEGGDVQVVVAGAGEGGGPLVTWPSAWCSRTMHVVTPDAGAARIRQIGGRAPVQREAGGRKVRRRRPVGTVGAWVSGTGGVAATTVTLSNTAVQGAVGMAADGQTDVGLRGHRDGVLAQRGPGVAIGGNRR